jgi:arginase
MQIIKIGLSSCPDTKESALAPEKIISELKKIESNERGEVVNYNSVNLEEINVNDNPLESDYNIFESSKEFFLKNDKIVFLGGEHSISYSILKAFNKIEKNPFLIVFDAHVDSQSSDLNNSWIKKLVESGFPPSSIVVVSARNFSYESMKFLKKYNIQVVKMDIINEDISGICDVLMERARNSSGFYISVDMSSIDPGFCPGAINPIPGGLSSREIIYFIKRLNLIRNFKGGDVVNLNPSMDLNNISLKLGAKIVSLMI